MQKILKVHKAQKQKYQSMKKFLQSLTPEQLSTVFSEDNFISMARNIKDVIRKTQDRTE
jgi:hypothetical protein